MSDVRALFQTPLSAFGAASLVLKAAPAANSGDFKLFALYAVNRAASAVYLQVWNSATIGSGTLVFQFLVPATSALLVGREFFSLSGVQFLGSAKQGSLAALPLSAAGVSVGLSTTNGSWTGATASNCDLMGMVGV